MKERERRKPLLKSLDLLFKLEASGWPVPDYYFENIGVQLGAGEMPKYKSGLSPEDFDKYVQRAIKNDIPEYVFRERLYKGKTPEVASTMPYRGKRGRV